VQVAFYAPMKAPTHSRPSGDRTIARLFIKALEKAGYAVALASQFRSYDKGDQGRQARLAELGPRLAYRYCRAVEAGRMPRPDIWLTYHLYHKAPDYFGPLVADYFDIPYGVAEASFAPKQAKGPWQHGHAHVAETLRRVDFVLGLNPHDAAMVKPLLKPSAFYEQFLPFLETDGFDLAPRGSPGDETVHLCTVAMMRDDAKKQSYAYLAIALSHMQTTRPWCLHVVGGGVAQSDVKGYFAVFGGRVVFHSALSKEATYEVMTRCDLYVWPAIKEAFGMAFLEAQASGLPVIAGAGSLGVESVVYGQVIPLGDPRDFGKAIEAKIETKETLRQEGAYAREKVKERHSLSAASRHLHDVFGRVLRNG